MRSASSRWKRDDQAVGARLKIVFDVREQAALHQFVGGGLEIVAAGLQRRFAVR